MPKKKNPYGHVYFDTLKGIDRFTDGVNIFSEEGIMYKERVDGTQNEIIITPEEKLKAFLFYQKHPELEDKPW
jgi:hypothetical protein